MQYHREPFLDETEVRAALERSLGTPPGLLTHLQTRSRHSVYQAVLPGEHVVILKADDGSSGPDFRLALESWAMEQARSMGMPVPAVLAQDLTRQQAPFRYLIMEQATGVPMSEASAGADVQRLALRAAGRWLARLHMIPVNGFGSLDEQAYLETGAIQGSFASWALPSSLRAEAALNELYAAGALGVDEAAGAMHLIESQSSTEQPESRLLHGDFSAGNLYIDPASGALTGVIDFGGRMGGDPLWDLAAAWLGNDGLPGLEEDATEILVQGHEAESGGRHPRRKLQAYCLMQALFQARSAYEQQQPEQFLNNRRRIDLLLEEAGLL